MTTALASDDGDGEDVKAAAAVVTIASCLIMKRRSRQGRCRAVPVCHLRGRQDRRGCRVGCQLSPC
jgi:hypothetical protein